MFEIQKRSKFMEKLIQLLSFFKVNSGIVRRQRIKIRKLIPMGITHQLS